MQISRNNQMEDFPTEGIQYFGQLMEQLTEKAAAEGGSVLSVKVNGEDLTGRDRSHLQDLPLDDIEHLEIQTGDPKELARSTLRSIAEFLEQLLKELHNTAELFRQGSSNQSNEFFVRCLDGLQVFMHSLEICRRLLGISFELLYSPSENGKADKAVAESRRQLFSVLDGMIQAQTDQDWVLMADMLEYELIPALEEWRQIIPAIQEKTAADQPVPVETDLVEAEPITVS